MGGASDALDASERILDPTTLIPMFFHFFRFRHRSEIICLEPSIPLRVFDVLLPNAIAQARASAHVACSNLLGMPISYRHLPLWKRLYPMKHLTAFAKAMDPERISPE
jgi:hypothetical protein